jgi:1-acyl-sn-glycerol-3-phosphate acyltransferase
MAPNHQNALMDALAVANNHKEAIVFLARSDIFKKKSTARILYLMKILPIYRIRDGASEVMKNKKVFDKTVQILKSNMRLTILPEGNHAGFRRLRPLQKGISRIAFQAEEAADFKLGIKIIPVGIDYSHYYKFRSDLFINYGPAIEVSDFYDTYKENPQKGMNDLKLKVAEQLSKVMLDIRTEKYYETCYALREIYRDRIGDHLNLNSCKQPGKFICDKSLNVMLDEYIDRKPEEFEAVDELVKEYTKGVEKLNLRDWVFKKKSHSILNIGLRILLLLPLLPIYIFGVINNYLPYKIPELVTKKVKDEQFISSFRYVVGLITFPIFYLIFSIVFFMLIPDPIWRTAYVLSLPLTGLFAFSYYKWSKKIWALLRFSFGISKSEKEQIFELRNDIREKLDEISVEIKPVEPDFS